MLRHYESPVLTLENGGIYKTTPSAMPDHTPDIHTFYIGCKKSLLWWLIKKVFGCEPLFLVMLDDRPYQSHWKIVMRQTGFSQIPATNIDQEDADEIMRMISISASRSPEEAVTIRCREPYGYAKDADKRRRD